MHEIWNHYWVFQQKYRVSQNPAPLDFVDFWKSRGGFSKVKGGILLHPGGILKIQRWYYTKSGGGGGGILGNPGEQVEWLPKGSSHFIYQF